MAEIEQKLVERLREMAGITPFDWGIPKREILAAAEEIESLERALIHLGNELGALEAGLGQRCMEQMAERSGALTNEIAARLRAAARHAMNHSLLIDAAEEIEALERRRAKDEAALKGRLRSDEAVAQVRSVLVSHGWPDAQEGTARYAIETAIAVATDVDRSTLEKCICPDENTLLGDCPRHGSVIRKANEYAAALARELGLPDRISANSTQQNPVTRETNG